MRLMTLATLALVSAVGVCEPLFPSDFETQSGPGLILVDTPLHIHAFTDCTIGALSVARHGTVFTVVANCAGRLSDPQAPGWLPAEHPDNAPQYWEGRMRLDEGSKTFSECVLLDHREYFGTFQLTAQCLDDPF